MPLPEILAELAAYVGDDAAKAKEVASALRKKSREETDPLSEHTEALNGIAQLLLNAGAGRKTGETTAKITEKQAEIDRLTGELEEARGEIETLRSKPDEKQQAHDREKAKLIARAEAAEKAVEEQRAGRKGDAVNLARSRFLGALKGRVDDFGLDAVDRRFSERFRAREDGSGVDVLDEDGDPIEAPKGKTPEEILAERAFETVPASNRLRQMNAGGGAPGGGTTVTADQLVQEKLATREFGSRF